MMKRNILFLVAGLGILSLIISACSGGIPQETVAQAMEADEAEAPVSGDQETDPLEGTSWELLFYRKSSMIEGTRITATFADGQVNGSAGCNSYFGSYQVEGQQLIMDGVGMTEMFCTSPEGIMDQETFFLEMLSGAETYHIEDGRLIIRKGHETLTFEPQESVD